MKAFKVFAVIAAAFLLTAPMQSAKAQTSSEGTTLTQSNGASAGLALLSLYTQYKSAGKLDLSNTTNLSNLITLATNIKGLSSSVKNSSFLTGLISGSKNLVNNSNSSTVLSSLSSLANLDLSSLSSTAASAATTAATSAAKKAASGLFSKLTGKVSSAASTATTAVNDAASTATTQANSILTSLFSAL